MMMIDYLFIITIIIIIIIIIILKLYQNLTFFIFDFDKMTKL